MSTRHISHAKLIVIEHIAILGGAICQNIIAKQAQCAHVFAEHPAQTHV